MKTGVAIGAMSGGVVVAAMWALAGDFVRDVGLAGAAVWLMGSGEVVDRDPYVAYRWGAIGAMVGLVVGATVGAVIAMKGREARGWFLGATAGVAGTIVSVTVVPFREELRFLVVPPVLAVVFGLLVLGTITGALSDFVVRRHARRRSAD